LFRLTPCQYELHAVLQRITSEQASSSVAGGVTFLLDGSGSVSQGAYSSISQICCKLTLAYAVSVSCNSFSWHCRGLFSHDRICVQGCDSHIGFGARLQGTLISFNILQCPRAAVACMCKDLQLLNDVCYGYAQPSMQHCVMQVGVMQFSNDVHIEIPLETQDKDNFEKAMADMV